MIHQYHYDLSVHMLVTQCKRLSKTMLAISFLAENIAFHSIDIKSSKLE